jgi:hypothetical protein
MRLASLLLATRRSVGTGRLRRRHLRLNDIEMVACDKTDLPSF